MKGTAKRAPFDNSDFRHPDFLRIFLCLLASLSLSHLSLAQNVIYPVPGHLDPGEGTIEFWLRLEVVLDPTGKEGVGYFPIFEVRKEDEQNPRIRFSYQPIWRQEHSHFFFSTLGLVNGAFAANPYVATVEDTQQQTKADYGAYRHPRIPRLKPGDWHHLAITWRGLPQSTVTMYFDGEVAIPSVLLHAPLWNDLDAFSLHLMRNPYRDAHLLDELRISAVVRSQEEIKQAIAAVTARADRHTLLLDHFDELREQGDKVQTVPEVFLLGGEATGGVFQRKGIAELVDGKSGKALKLIRHYR